ncbi:MAG TPA: NAD-dependent epimerase/dehydratase family protein [Candidatus Dormibacteraeota bacterium]
MRVLITGGAGFVGSHVAEHLARRGEHVVVVDNMLTGNAGNLAALSTDACTVLHRDVTRPLEVEGPLDAVLHFASPASPPDYTAHPVATLDVGTAGTRSMLELARVKNARFMLASTSEVYGDPQEHPQREDYWGNVNPIGPRSVYDEAKRCAEAYTMAYHRAGLDTRITRIFNTYGPRMRGDDGRAIPNFVSQALAGQALTVYGDGSQTRSLCYVDDLVDGIVLLLDSSEHRPVNLGNPAEITVRQLARTVAAVCGAPVDRMEFLPLPEDDPHRRCPDIARAHQVLGWEPVTELTEGLQLTVRWVRDSQP